MNQGPNPRTGSARLRQIEHLVRPPLAQYTENGVLEGVNGILLGISPERTIRHVESRRSLPEGTAHESVHS